MTECRCLGDLSQLHEFLLNSEAQARSGPVPERSRNSNRENQVTNEQCSQNGPHPEVGVSLSYFSQELGLEETSYLVAGVQEEILCCSIGTSSGKQMEPCSTCGQQFGSETTPVSIEADRILMVLKQLASSNNSANFNKNINQIFKLPKSLTTTMPTFNRKSEKFEPFEDLFQTSCKIQNQLTGDNKIIYFQFFMRGYVLQTFKKISSTSR